MRKHHTRQSLGCLAGVALLAATVAFSGVAAAQGPPQTTFTTTANLPFAQPQGLEKEWVSDGVSHTRNAPNVGGTFVGGPFNGGTWSAVANSNFNLKTLEGVGWGTATYATPIGTFEGSYTERISFDPTTFTLVFVGGFTGRSSDGRMLRLEWVGSGLLVGDVITYAVEGTILDPPS